MANDISTIRAGEPETTEPFLIAESEARRLLGNLCAKTMYNLRQRGFPFVRVGARIMYDPREVRMWIEQQKGGAR